jgi:hypothetical protein
MFVDLSPQFPYFIFCKEHERTCCRICILEYHKDCKEVTVLENIINNVKNSHMFNEIEQSTSSTRVSIVILLSFSVNSFIRFSCNLSRWLLTLVLSSCISSWIIRFCSLMELELVSLFCLNHSSWKLSRGHTTIPIIEYQKLPSYVLDIKEHCNEHHEKFNLYCKEHECPCCRICNVENHKDCKWSWSLYFV